ncbi:DUF1285 domain-containing protein [Ningiella sp. W23]|uniref:DUF1285 domain-containing protein n=1 Tax=Ningiella sp. W23 TaxID=3023715 RepID=UPI00375758A0
MDIRTLQDQIAETTEAGAMPPVEKWHPDFCGDLNLVIKKNGQWWHEGTPFTRASLIKLFASVIKKEGNDYFLVTPVEKLGIVVEDVPFIAIDDDFVAQPNGDTFIEITTSCGDKVRIGKDHPIELREFDNNPVPYCLIRRNLWARVHQNVLYRWVENAHALTINHENALVLNSGDYEFVIGYY